MSIENVKLSDLKKELNKDFLYRSPWIYVKIQSLIEYINNIYVDKQSYNLNAYEFKISTIEKSYEILKKEFQDYNTITKTIDMFKKINYYANILKHSHERAKLKEVFFDEALIYSFLEVYKNYCKILFKRNYLAYLIYLDEIDLSNDKKDKKKISSIKKDEANTRSLEKAQVRKSEVNVKTISDIYWEEESPKTLVNKGNQLKNISKNQITYIPSDVGENNYGFFIVGVNKTSKCRDPDQSVYAVIYNYLQRTNNIDEKSGRPHFLKERQDLSYELDYRNIYQLMMIILVMIKNNYLEQNTLHFSYDGNKKELDISLEIINNYIKLICKMTTVEKIPIIKFKSSSSLRVSIEEKDNSDIYIENYIDNTNKKKINSREVWFAPKINYNISDDNKIDLEYFLKDFSNHQEFNEGQFESLKEMLNGKWHKICIMPTGSGKSLLFYIASLLQPGASFVIAPTKLLIRDQINNLRSQTYNITDVVNLDTTTDYLSLDLENKIYFLTPDTLQNKDLLKNLISFNNDKKIAYIVLDEVHCISRWSHNFRPEYLMTSTYLNKFLDRTYFLCYTATANYSVIKDIKKQLNLADDDIISPVRLDNNYIDFQYIGCDSFIEMIEVSKNFLFKSANEGSKTLVFTKSMGVSEKIKHSLRKMGLDVQVYARGVDEESYESFRDGNCKILISSDDIGIGINLLDVDNVLHFGVPISKSQYVQEIGRAGRYFGKSTSLVVYMRPLFLNTDEKLIKRNTDVAFLVDSINNNQEQIENDYLTTYKNIINNFGEMEDFYKRTISIYEKILDEGTWVEIETSMEEENKTKKSLFILFSLGIINSWSIYNLSQTRTIFLLAKENKELSLGDIKEIAKRQIYFLGNYGDSLYMVTDSKTIEEVIASYIYWIYNQFIYHHKEQFLDMLSFIEIYENKDKAKVSNQEILSHLSGYFSLSMLNISEDENKFSNLSYEEIVKLVFEGVENSVIVNIQRLLEDRYNTKFDYFIFIHGLIMEGYFDNNRLERLVDKIDKSSFFDFSESLSLVYDILDNNDKFELFKYSIKLTKKLEIDYSLFFDIIYRVNDKDLIYFGILSKKINIKQRGAINV